MTPEEAKIVLNEEFGNLDSYGNEYLIRDYLGVKTPLETDFMMWFAIRIAALQKFEGFEVFKGKLKSKDNIRFEEALSILEIAYTFASASFLISFIPVSNSKTSDMQLHTGKTDMNVEVTQIFESNFDNELNKLRREIQKKVIKFRVCYAGVIRIPVDKYNDIDFVKFTGYDILERLEYNLNAVEQTNKFLTFKIDDVVDFAIAPKDSGVNSKCVDSDLFTEWIEKKNEELDGEVKLSAGGIVYYWPKKDIFNKIMGNIKKQKREQMSYQDKAGILVIVNKYSYSIGMFNNNNNVQYFIKTFEEYMSNIPEAAIFIFYSQFGGFSNYEIIKTEQHAFISKPFNLAPDSISMTEQCVIILNKNASGMEMKEIFDSIVDAFETD